MLRIRGVVRVAQHVRNRLRVGLPPADLEPFKQFVAHQVEEIERIIAHHGCAPPDLPPPSRKAYEFLKSIDLNGLPTARAEAPAHPSRTLGLKHIAVNERAVLHSMSGLASGVAPAIERERLRGMIERFVAAVERVCAMNDVTPADLTPPSRRVYSFLKFLAAEANFDAHLEATRRAWHLAQAARREGPPDTPAATVEFTNMAGLARRLARREGLVIRLSEGFIRADDEVLAGLIRAMLFGRSRGLDRIVRDFAVSEDFCDVLLELDLAAEVMAEDGRGECHDLDLLFDRVNGEYFGGRLSRPRLAWSRRLTHRKFGHYECARDRVVMSLTLDDPRVPAFVVEFVLYHEVLHRVHPPRWSGPRRLPHTREFREAEREFTQYHEAREWFGKLAR